LANGNVYYGNAPFQNHPNDMSDTMQTFLSNMGSLLKNNNKSRDSITDLPKFQGLDTQWPKWYQLLRAYLQAKGWLTTFDHPIGPGTALAPTPGFDMDKTGKSTKSFIPNVGMELPSHTFERQQNSMVMVPEKH
jgi:hypothetical protein